MANDYTSQIATLRETQGFLSAGYAQDLIEEFIEVAKGGSSDGDSVVRSAEAGDLFRTLVLDEQFSVDEAREVYNAAYDIASP